MRLMIVDDDRQIREGITYGIQWENLGIEHAECFRNGLEALEAFKREPFDIILTDISMPGMTGIELMKEIKELSPMTVVVLISGYEEFEYARAAIKYGAQDYILKPIHLDKVMETIQEITIRAKGDRKIHFMAKEAEKTKTFQTLLREYRENGAAEPEEIRKYLVETCSFEDPGPFLLMMIEDDQMSGHFADQGADQMVRQKITELFAGHRHCIITVDDNRELLLIHAPASALYLVSIQNLGRRLKTEINESPETASSLSVSLSGICYVKDLLTGYSLCSRLMQLRYFRGRRQFFTVEDEKPEGGDKEHLDQILTRLTEAVIRLQTEDCHGLCREAEEELRFLGREEVENIVFLQLREASIKSHTEEKPEELLQSLRSCDTFSETMGLWKEELDRIMENAAGVGGLSREMREAILFIQKNYDKRITTEDVADHLHISSGHLSRMFRKEINESPKRYINLYRIRIAENLLETTNMKIYEVADQVGISDYKYFAQVFKSITGVTPLDIRKGSDEKE